MGKNVFNRYNDQYNENDEPLHEAFVKKYGEI